MPLTTEYTLFVVKRAENLKINAKEAVENEL